MEQKWKKNINFVVVDDTTGHQLSEIRWSADTVTRDTWSDETQEHLELCTCFAHEQSDLQIKTDTGKSIFWQRMAPKLKSMANKDNLKELNIKIKQKKLE